MYRLLLFREGHGQRQGQEKGKGGHYSGKLVIFEAQNNNENCFSI